MSLKIPRPDEVRLQAAPLLERGGRRAWDQSIPWLQRECHELAVPGSSAPEYTAILEYALPRDSRRPDIIVLERGCVAVLKLKGALHPSRAALDQALGGTRDLSAYHSACAGRQVNSVLLTRGSGARPALQDGVCDVGPEGLDALLQHLSDASQPVISGRDFLADDAYPPQRSIIQAAHRPMHQVQSVLTGLLR